ncbi:MAG: hypothetical protein CL558_06185 [Alphaproteobacteria bacterium]|nr:hypothetical protein [Alphaproteobacteria bacterium]
MRSKLIVQSMLENGFLDSAKHNPNDYITYVVQAAKLLEASLKDVKQHESVTEVISAMFDAGFCNPKDQKDPSEWTMFAESAVAELKVL